MDNDHHVDVVGHHRVLGDGNVAIAHGRRMMDLILCKFPDCGQMHFCMVDFSDFFWGGGKQTCDTKWRRRWLFLQRKMMFMLDKENKSACCCGDQLSDLDDGVTWAEGPLDIP